MDIKRLLLGAMAASVALATSPAHAKAQTHWGKVKNVEAVVMQVEASDAPADADFNILIRPVSPEKSAAFWKHFWKPSNQEWIDDTLGPAFDDARGKFSAECRQCAGTGSDGAGCNIREGVQYDTNPCPRFFGCAACLYDLERLSGMALENLTVKAELFFGQDATPFPTGVGVPYEGIDGKVYWSVNDLNFRLSDTLFTLGFKDDKGRRHTDEGKACDELSWNKDTNRYDQVAGLSVCGKSLWVSGMVSHDEAHDYRPEVHPVYSMTLDEGMVGNNTHAVRAGTFIDGSMDDWAPWSYDYHKDGQADLPPSVTLDLGAAPYQPAKSVNHCVYADSGGRCDLWVPECSVNNLTSFNVKKASLEPATDRCGQQKVDMDWYAINGAAWVSKAQLGWQQQDYSFVVSAKQMEPYGGILAVEPPLSYTVKSATRTITQPRTVLSVVEKDRIRTTAGGLQVAKFDPSVLGKLLVPECEVPAGSPAGKLKRWYRWKIHAKASFPKVPANTLSWQWLKPTQASKLVPQPPASVAQPGYDFDVWMPAPSFDSPPYHATYQGALRGAVSLNGKELVWHSEELEVTPPSVMIATHDAKLEQGTEFSVQLTANTLRLCGNTSKFKYEWTRDLSPVANWIGPGPHPVSLKPGEKTIIGLMVTDEFGVESVVDEQVLIAPQLKVETEVACASAGASAADRVPPGWPQPLQELGSRTLCSSTQIKASASALPHGAEVIFPESSVGTVTYAWTDVKVAFENSSSTWQPVPANWKVSYESPSNRTMTITPDKQTFFYFQATVTATDQYGRTATANVTGSNDFTPIPNLIDRVARLYPVWRPGKTPPGCAGDCAFGPDVLDNEVAVFLSKARAANPADARATAALRKQFHQLSQFAFAKISAERKLPFTRLAKPVFTARETSIRPLRKELINKARMESIQRLNQKVRATP